MCRRRRRTLLCHLDVEKKTYDEPGHVLSEGKREQREFHRVIPFYSVGCLETLLPQINFEKNSPPAEFASGFFSSSAV